MWFPDAFGGRSAPSESGKAAEGAQEEASRAAPEQLFHGCQVPGLLCDFHHIFTCTVGGAMQGLLDNIVHVDGGESTTHRGLQLPQKTALNNFYFFVLYLKCKFVF